MLVTLPLALLLLDWWPLGRMAPTDAPDAPSWRLSMPALRRLAWEKFPLLLMSAISCAITYLGRAKGGAMLSFGHIPFRSRIANAFASYAVYLGKMVWPSSLAVYYPHPASIHADVPAWEIVGSILLFCGFFATVLWASRRRPYLAVGWLWYVGTLVPVIGLVQVGGQAHADRYTYVPLIGLFIALSWGVPPAFSRLRARRLVLGAFAGASLLALSTVARVQAGYWRDSVTLFSRAASVTDGNWFALNNLGVSYNDLGQYREAVGYLREALRIKPNCPEAWCNLGVSYGKSGQYREAVGYLREALRIEPRYAKAWNHLGLACYGLGQYQEAVAAFHEAVRLRPDYADAWNSLGASCYRLGQYPAAVGYFREALRIKPDYSDARNNLAMVGRTPLTPRGQGDPTPPR